MPQLTKCPSCGTVQHITPNQRKKCDNDLCEQLLYLDLGFPDNSPDELLSTPSKRASTGHQQLQETIIENDQNWQQPIVTLEIIYIIISLLIKSDSDYFLVLGSTVNFLFIFLLSLLFTMNYPGKDNDHTNSSPMHGIAVSFWIIGAFQLSISQINTNQRLWEAIGAGLVGLVIQAILTVTALILAYITYKTINRKK